MYGLFSLFKGNSVKAPFEDILGKRGKKGVKATDCFKLAVFLNQNLLTINLF